ASRSAGTQAQPAGTQCVGQSSVAAGVDRHLRDDAPEVEAGRRRALQSERGGRKGLDPDKTAAVLAKAGKGGSFGKAWRGLSRERQNEIVQKLLTETNEEALIDWLVEECGLSEAAATAASNARLPQGHGHIGRSLLADLLDVMEHESAEATHPDTGEIYPRPLTYDEAVERLGLHHSKLEIGKRTRLPYYG